MLTMLAAIATFEREMVLERQHEGIRFAKEKGKYQGRKPTARVKSVEVVELTASGKSRATVAKELGMRVASVHRIIKEHKAVPAEK